MYNPAYPARATFSMRLQENRDHIIHKPDQKEKCRKELEKYFELVNDDLKTKVGQKCKVPEVVFKAS